MNVERGGTRRGPGAWVMGLLGVASIACQAAAQEEEIVDARVRDVGVPTAAEAAGAGDVSAPYTSYPYLLGPWEVDTSGVRVLGPGQTWIPANPVWTPDRDPVIFLQIWNGDFCSGPRGSAWEWSDPADDNPNLMPRDQRNAQWQPVANGIPDAFDHLLRLMNSYYDNGWRRIVLLLPAGVVQGQDMPNAQWWALPRWKKEGMWQHLEPWIRARPDVSFGLYLNVTINDRHSLCDAPNPYRVVSRPPSSACGGLGKWVFPCAGQAVTRIPNPRNAEDCRIFFASIKPWIDIGVREFWYDESAGSAREQMKEFMWSPDYAGVGLKLGGEAMPTSVVQPFGDPDVNSILAGPWFCTDAFTPPRGWNFASKIDRTELGVAMYNPPAGYDFKYVWDWVKRGFVIWHYNTGGRSDEYAQRIYSFGRIADIADFDGNGIVDVSNNAGDTVVSDLERFVEHWIYTMDDTSGRPWNFIHGEINNDGQVDVFDYYDFLNAAQGSVAGNPVSVDLGTPNPEGAMPW